MFGFSCDLSPVCEAFEYFPLFFSHFFFVLFLFFIFVKYNIYSTFTFILILKSQALRTAGLVSSALTRACVLNGSQLLPTAAGQVSVYSHLLCEDAEPAFLSGDRSLFLSDRHLEGHYHYYMGALSFVGSLFKMFAFLIFRS